MGLSVAKLLARKGASVVIVARSVERLKAALAEISVRCYPSAPRTFNPTALLKS